MLPVVAPLMLDRDVKGGRGSTFEQESRPAVSSDGEVVFQGVCIHVTLKAVSSEFAIDDLFIQENIMAITSTTLRIIHSSPSFYP